MIMGKPWSKERREKWARKKIAEINRKWGEHIFSMGLNAEAVSVDDLSEEKKEPRPDD
jgi:hypothetical protein